MGKYDNMMKCAQIRSLANEKQYRNAYEVLQTLNIDQITSIADLNTIADVLIQLQKYEEAKDVYLKLYNRIPNRRVLYQLIYLSLKCGDMEEAEEYYEEYQEMDKSSDRLILRYYIDKAKGVSRQALIGSLQELKKEDYMEEWAYELAKLYHKEGMREECIQECSDIILWFGEGLIVEKAMLLKHHYLDGADISSEKAIMEETRNLAADLKIAAAIAEKNEREKAQREAEAQAAAEEYVTAEEPEAAYKEPAVYAENVEYAKEQYAYEEPAEYAKGQYAYEELAEYAKEQYAYDEPTEYAKEQYDYEETAKYVEEQEKQPVQEEQVYTAHAYHTAAENYEKEVLAEEPSEIEREIAKIVCDIKKEKEPGHIAISGEISDKNIEISKYLAKELCRQQVLPTSKIARIRAERLNEVNLQENQQKLLGGCLLIEEASGLSLDSIQNLYQFINKSRGNVIIIFTDTEEKIEALLKKNRKLGNLVEYHIEV